MIVKMSSKGQLVIPKSIRNALHLEPGDEIDLRLVHDKVILQPVRNPVEADAVLQGLYGMFNNEPLIALLEKNRHDELEKDDRRTQSLCA